jgi:hypothetical protein
MKKTYPDLPQWTFDIDEVSAGVYEVIGKDTTGHVVSSKGIDVDLLIQECRNDALSITGERAHEK